jgi:hypothetical protein
MWNTLYAAQASGVVRADEGLQRWYSRVEQPQPRNTHFSSLHGQLFAAANLVLSAARFCAARAG